MCEGKSFHGATSNSRKSDGMNRQTIGGRGIRYVMAFVCMTGEPVNIMSKKAVVKFQFKKPIRR